MTADHRGRGAPAEGLTASEAARLILGHCAPPTPTRRPLREALNLVLAEDVASPIEIPAADNSAMDGYAVRTADVLGATRDRPVTLRVLETVVAGQVPGRAVEPGTAVRLFTGVAIPVGADRVIRQEDTTADGDRVAVLGVARGPSNVRHRGEDVRAGERVLTRGTVLGPAQLGVLASIAFATPLVRPQPRVAFLASGDEIADLDRADDILAGHKVATANSYTLFGLIRQAGGRATDLGIARDTPESVRAHVLRAQNAGLFVTTGGVSVGAHDLIRSALTALGCEMKLWRVRIRPGAPLGFGILFGKPWIGLPGNPVSTMVTFELFVRPVIRQLLGHSQPFRRAVPVQVADTITLAPGLRHFLRVVVTPDGPAGTLVARLTGPQGSGILTSMARANALLIVPEDRGTVAPGAVLDALILDDPHHVAEPPF